MLADMSCFSHREYERRMQNHILSKFPFDLKCTIRSLQKLLLPI